MRPNKAETAVHGCNCPGDMVVCMLKVLASSWVGVLSVSLAFTGYLDVIYSAARVLNPLAHLSTRACTKSN